MLITDPYSSGLNSYSTVQEAKDRVEYYYPSVSVFRWDDEDDAVIELCLIGAMGIMDEIFQWVGYRSFRRQVHSFPRRDEDEYRFSFSPLEITQDIKDIQILIAYCVEYRNLKRRLSDDLSNESPGFDLLVTQLSASGLGVGTSSPDTYSEMEQILSDPFHHITRLSKPYTASIRGGVVRKRIQYDYSTTTSTTSTSSTTSTTSTTTA